MLMGGPIAIGVLRGRGSHGDVREAVDHESVCPPRDLRVTRPKSARRCSIESMSNSFVK
jgi:hypothetical protein